jgi:hypothetical protein
VIPMPPDTALQDLNLKIFFNPWAFTIEENNGFLALGYEPMPIRIPDVR